MERASHQHLHDVRCSATCVPAVVESVKLHVIVCLASPPKHVYSSVTVGVSAVVTPSHVDVHLCPPVSVGGVMTFGLKSC